MSLPRFTRPQSLASWQLESATPVAVDTDWYWTSVEMQQLDARILVIAKQLRGSQYLSNAEVGRLESQRAGLNQEWEALEAHRDQLEAEYGKRRWNRAWLVTSSDGHIHANPVCSTFKDRTTCTLLPQASGMSHAELVDAAGEKACTVCFPGAPVKPCTLRDPLTVQEQDAKAAEKAVKAAKAATQVITTPEGQPLYTARMGLAGAFRNGDLVKTETTAGRRATSTLKDLGWYGLGFDDDEANIETFRRLVRALAAKQDRDVWVLATEYFDKAARAVKRDGGEMLVPLTEISTWF